MTREGQSRRETRRSNIEASGFGEARSAGPILAAGSLQSAIECGAIMAAEHSTIPRTHSATGRTGTKALTIPPLARENSTT